MYDCTVTTSKAAADITAIIVGHTDAQAPAAIEREAARLAAGDCEGPIDLIVDDQRYLLLKLGDEPWLVGGENWRMLGNQIVSALRKAGLSSCSVELAGAAADAQALVEGALLGDYVYDAMRSGKAAKRTRISLRLPGQNLAVREGKRVATAQNLARELSDAPANAIDPQTFVRRARSVFRGTGCKLKVISGEEALSRAGFPGLCQVGRGGSVPPAFLQIRYVPTGTRKTKHKLALVGKGITFDAGGISLKPGANMWEMKADMGGASAVFAAMHAIAEAQPALPVDGIIGLAENMPDAKAQKPGDIYKARNGKYVHVDNTDAEGRLVLADLLTYAGEQGATHIIDLATLTGACLIALGPNVAAVMGNDEDWVGQVRAIGQQRGEEFWPLPLYGEYRKMLDHPHADLNNIGQRYGGTITAGLFLKEFVDPKVKWAHCDIAGPVIQTKAPWRYYARGMTGFGTRTMAALATTLKRLS